MEDGYKSNSRPNGYTCQLMTTMAEDGEVQGRNGAKVKSCSPCSRRDMFVEAVKFCIKCETFFCFDCSGQHDNLLQHPPMKDLGDDDLRVAVHLPTEMCQEHASLITMYCPDDDVVGCPTCMALQHRSCNDVVFYPNSVDEIIKPNHVIKVKDTLNRTIQRLESIKRKKQAVIESLKNEKETCLADIDDYHKHLQSLLAKAMKTSKEMVHLNFESIIDDTDTNLQEAEHLLADLASARASFEKELKNDAQMFIEVKKCETILTTVETISTEAEESLNINGLAVVIDRKMENLLNEAGRLAEVVRRLPTKVNTNYAVDISVDDDQDRCDVNGSCILDDGSLVLSDFNNKKLKRMNGNSLEIIDYCTVDAYPIDICCLKNDEVAVTGENSIMFFLSKPRLTPARTMKLSHECGYITYSNDELIVSDNCKSLYVYDTIGSLIRTISGVHQLSKIRHIACSGIGHRIYVADMDNGVVTLSREGSLLETFRNPLISGTYCVCPDGLGSIFTAGWDCNTIVHIGQTKMVSIGLKSGSGGLCKPQSLCYDRKQHKCYVSQCNSSEMVVYELDRLYDHVSG